MLNSDKPNYVKTIVFTAALFIALFALGLTIGEDFSDYCLTFLTRESIVFNDTAIGDQFLRTWSFAFALALVPVILAVLPRLAHIPDRRTMLISLLIILATGFLNIVLQLWLVARKLDLASGFLDGAKIPISVPSIGYYLLIGFLFGGGLCLFFFRKKKQKTEMTGPDE